MKGMVITPEIAKWSRVVTVPARSVHVPIVTQCHCIAQVGQNDTTNTFIATVHDILIDTRKMGMEYTR